MSNLARSVIGLCALLPTLSLQVAVWSQESLNFPQDYRREISKILEEPLNDLTAEAPGLERASRESIGLVIGNLQVVSSDNLPWGLALGQFLRWKIPYAPHALLRVPHPDPDRIVVDLHPRDINNQELALLEALAPAFGRQHMENALIGEAQIGHSTFTLRLDLYSLPSRTLRKDFNAAGALEDLPGALGRMSLEVLSTLQISLDQMAREYVGKSAPLTFGQLRRFAELLALGRQSKPEDIIAEFEDYWNEGVEIPAIAPTFCEAIYNNRDMLNTRAIELLDSVRQRFPKHPAVECVVFRYWPYVNSGQKRESLYDAYRQLAGENPIDVVPLLRMGDIAIDDGNDAVLACSLDLHAVECFPWNFRTWWALSEVLKRVAQKARQGDLKGPETLSVQSAAQFQSFSDSAFARALEIFPDSPTLLRENLNRIWFSDGLSPEFWNVFDRIVDAGETDPTFYRKSFGNLAAAGVRDFDSAMRILNGSLRNCSDASVNEMLFQNGCTALDALDREAAADPAKLCEMAESLNKAYLTLVEKRNSSDIPLGLESCLQVGANAHALTSARKRLQTAKAANKDLTTGFVQLAEIALALGDGDLAKECLDTFRFTSDSQTPNLEDCIGSLRAMIPSTKGDHEETRRQLERRIAEAEDNLYSCLRYLELGMKQPIDEQVKAECERFLIEYAPDEFDYGNPANTLGAAVGQEMTVRYVQDVLRWFANGHKASTAGDHAGAEKAYRRAARGVFYLAVTTGSVLTPYPVIHLWRERRVLTGQAGAK